MGVNVQQHRAAIGVYYFNRRGARSPPKDKFAVLKCAFFRFLLEILVLLAVLNNTGHCFLKNLRKNIFNFQQQILYITLCYYYFRCSLFLSICGDIHTNPGPNIDGHLKIANWNSNSLPAHNFIRISLIQAYNANYQCHLIGITESALTNAIADEKIALEGYTPIRNDLSGNASHGGVLLYHKSDLAAKHRTDIQNQINTIVLELSIARKKVFYILVYRKFGQSLEEFKIFIANLDEMLQKINSENPHCIILGGDFNAHLNEWWEGDKDDIYGLSLKDTFNTHGITQIVNQPTYITNNSKTCIDLIGTDQPNLVLANEIHPSLHSNSHHQINFVKFNLKYPPPPSFERRIWHYSRANIPAIQNSLLQYNWDQSLGNLSEDPDSQVEHLENVVMNVAQNFIPFDDKKINPRDPPWLTKSAKFLYRKYKKKFKKFAKRGYIEREKIEIDTLKNAYTTMVENDKERYMLSLGEAVASPQSGPKKYWSAMKKLLNKNIASIIPPILHNGSFTTDVQEKCNIFNDYFKNQCTVIQTSSTVPDRINKCTDILLNNVEFTENIILEHIQKLNVNKAHGHDGISIRILKICDKSISKPLFIIFKNCIDKGYFPKKWKKANVIPIYKKNEKNLVGNHRPVSLLPIFGKLFEKVIFNNLYDHIFRNNLISDKQSGYRRGDSTVKQLLSITHEIYKAFDASHEVRAVFLDISRAFDRVWHEGLIYKLQTFGVGGDILRILSSFLTNRMQRVTIDGQFSEWANIEAGVPQGSLLGPILFLIFINDLVNIVESDIRIFADDTFIFTIANSESTDKLNRDLKKITKWAYDWKMIFNPDIKKQAVDVIFSNKRKPSEFEELIFNNIPVKNVTETKHLGMILDRKLSFNKHIQEKIAKANRGLGIMKHLKKWISHNTLTVIYLMYVRPHLDYGDIVFDISDLNTNSVFESNTSSLIAKKTEKVQYEAAKIILGAWHGTSREKLYDILGWESLHNRRNLRKLNLLYEIHKEKSPRYLQLIMADQKFSVNSRFYNKFLFKDIICRTNSYKTSFFPSTIKSWNKLDVSIRNSKSKNIFKNRLLNQIRPKKKSYFGIRNNDKIRNLTMLRVGLSPLRGHKFKHNFLDTTDPYCLNCGSIEDTKHYLLHCSSFTLHRNTLLQNISNLLNCDTSILTENKLIDILLYGKKGLEIEINTRILDTVTVYITNSNRFE